MLEFRDALTHIKRALFFEDERHALLEINIVSEHIRRAAGDSIQNYVESKFEKIRDRVDTPLPIYYLILYKNPDIKLIKKKENFIKSCIHKGLEAKPKKDWRKSVAYFHEAEKELDELEKILPPIRQLHFTSLELSLVITSIIIGFLLATGLIVISEHL